MAIRTGQLRTLKWRYIDNLGPSLSYRINRQSTNGEVSRVISELDQRGIAITTAQTLLGPDSCYNELKVAVDNLESHMADQIATARANVDNPKAWKSFTLQLLGKRPLLDPDEIYVRFALQKPVLQIANAYFGMYTRLRFYNIWHTLPTNLSPRQSQLWHRDPEDRYIFKMFVLLSNVDDRAGPFTYAAGSHPKGGLRRYPAYTVTKKDRARRSTDSQMAEVVSPNKWVKGVGTEGTIIFADTRGFHKGGFACEQDRIIYVCMFTSQASRYPEMFERPEKISIPQDKERAFALGLRQRA